MTGPFASSGALHCWPCKWSTYVCRGSARQLGRLRWRDTAVSEARYGGKGQVGHSNRNPKFLTRKRKGNAVARWQCRFCLACASKQEWDDLSAWGRNFNAKKHRQRSHQHIPYAVWMKKMRANHNPSARARKRGFQFNYTMATSKMNALGPKFEMFIWPRKMNKGKRDDGAAHCFRSVQCKQCRRCF